MGDILSIFRNDGWRIGNCSVRVYDRRKPELWGVHFLEGLYDQCVASNVLYDLFCGMIDLSSDAICSYLHTRSPLLVMCVDSEDPQHIGNNVFTTAGFAFPTINIGGFLMPNPEPNGKPLSSESAMVLGYGYLKPWWGTKESVILGMLTLAYFFENHNLTAVHGQSYPWNGLTAKFTSQFGVKPSGTLPRFLQTAEGKLVDCNLSTLLREDFEEYVNTTIRKLAADSIRDHKGSDSNGEGRTGRT